MKDKLVELGRKAVQPISKYVLLTPHDFSQIQTQITTTILQIENLTKILQNSLDNIRDDKLKVEILKSLDKYDKEIKGLIEKFYSEKSLTSDEVKKLLDYFQSIPNIDNNIQVNIDANLLSQTLEKFSSKVATDQFKELVSKDVYSYFTNIVSKLDNEITQIQSQISELKDTGRDVSDLESYLEELVKLQEEISNVLSSTPEELAYNSKLQEKVYSLLKIIHEKDLDKVTDSLYDVSKKYSTLIGTQKDIQSELETTYKGRKIEEWFKKFSTAFSTGSYTSYLQGALTTFGYDVDPRVGLALQLGFDLFGDRLLGGLFKGVKGLGKFGLGLFGKTKLGSRLLSKAPVLASKLPITTGGVIGNTLLESSKLSPILNTGTKATNLLSKGLSFIKPVGNILGKVALPLTTLSTVYDIASDYSKAKEEGKGTLGAVADALTSSDTGIKGFLKSVLKGGSAGFVAGSAIPVIGNLTGAIVGAVAGGLGFLGKSLIENHFGSKKESNDNSSQNIQALVATYANNFTLPQLKSMYESSNNDIEKQAIAKAIELKKGFGVVSEHESQTKNIPTQFSTISDISSDSTISSAFENVNQSDNSSKLTDKQSSIFSNLQGKLSEIALKTLPFGILTNFIKSSSVSNFFEGTHNLISGTATDLVNGVTKLFGLDSLVTNSQVLPGSVEYISNLNNWVNNSVAPTSTQTEVSVPDIEPIETSNKSLDNTHQVVQQPAQQPQPIIINHQAPSHSAYQPVEDYFIISKLLLGY